MMSGLLVVMGYGSALLKDHPTHAKEKDDNDPPFDEKTHLTSGLLLLATLQTNG